MALPVIVRVCFDPGALSVNTMLPVPPVVEVGEYVILKDVACPGVTVAGKVRPLIPKPTPETVAALITRFAFPLLVIVTLCVLVWLTGTLLKFKDIEENDGIAAMPVPVSPMLNGELVASLVTVSAPETAAIVVGAN